MRDHSSEKSVSDGALLRDVGCGAVLSALCASGGEMDRDVQCMGEDAGIDYLVKQLDIYVWITKYVEKTANLSFDVEKRK